MMVLGAVLLAATSVWFWQPSIANGFAVQCAMIVIILVLGYRVNKRQSRVVLEPIQLSERGEWMWLDKQQTAQVSQGSRVLPFAIFVQLVSPTAGRQYVWVLKDMLTDQDYRRLSRIVCRKLQQGQS